MDFNSLGTIHRNRIRMHNDAMYRRLEIADANTYMKQITCKEWEHEFNFNEPVGISPFSIEGKAPKRGQQFICKKCGWYAFLETTRYEEEQICQTLTKRYVPRHGGSLD